MEQGKALKSTQAGILGQKAPRRMADEYIAGEMVQEGGADLDFGNYGIVTWRGMTLKTFMALSLNRTRTKS